MQRSTMDGDPIPASLRAKRQWVRWALATNPGGKPTKSPDQSTNDPSRFRSYVDLAAVARTAASGIGFVFRGATLVRLTDGRDATLIGIDFDGCRDTVTGELTRWSTEILDRLQTYTEISPSGAGLHALVLVLHPPEGITAVRKLPGQAAPNTKGKAEVQLFGLGATHYLTVTGDVLPEFTRLNVVTDLDWLVKRLHLDEVPPLTAKDLPVGLGDVPTLAEISARVSTVPGGRELIEGNWRAVCPDKSASEGFAALVAHAVVAAGGHGEAAVEWLLHATAWGRGEIDDSRDPSRYMTRAWVRKDVLRVAGKSRTASMDVFQPLTDEPEPTKAPKARLVPHEVFLASREDQLFLVHNLLPRTGLAQVYGDPGTGKTPFAMSLAFHVAGGLKDWFGHEIQREDRKVVYMVGEDANGLGWRAEAQQNALGLTTAQVNANLLWSTQPGRLTDTEDVIRWAKEIRELTPSLALLIVDTQSRNFGDGNENDTQDMTRFVNNLAGLAAGLKCLIMLVHHTGHQSKERARGSSVLFGALDASFSLVREGNAIKIEPGKAKNWERQPPFSGQLVQVTVRPADETGRPAVTSVYLDTKAPDQVFSALGDDKLSTEDPVVRQVLETVVLLDGSKGRLTDAELCAATGATRWKVAAAVKRLEKDLGFITTVKGDVRSAGTVYAATEEGLRAVCG